MLWSHTRPQIVAARSPQVRKCDANMFPGV
jgi:hypothetical protein